MSTNLTPPECGYFVSTFTPADRLSAIDERTDRGLSIRATMLGCDVVRERHRRVRVSQLVRGLTRSQLPRQERRQGPPQRVRRDLEVQPGLPHDRPQTL